MITPLNQTYIKKILNNKNLLLLTNYFNIDVRSARVWNNRDGIKNKYRIKIEMNFLKFYKRCYKNKNMFLNFSNMAFFGIDIKTNKIFTPTILKISDGYNDINRLLGYIYYEFFFKYIGVSTKYLKMIENCQNINGDPFRIDKLFTNMLFNNNKIFSSTFIKDTSDIGLSWRIHIVKQFDPNIVFSENVYKYMENLYKIKQITNI